MKTWTATAFVRSVRPDTTWPLPRSTVLDLETAWLRLAPSPRVAEPDASRPYAGCAVRDGEGREWIVCNGLVTLRHGERDDRRADPDRAFERIVLTSAPPRALPPGPLPLGPPSPGPPPAPPTPGPTASQ